jgi:meiosis-specific protein HOP1
MNARRNINYQDFIYGKNTAKKTDANGSTAFDQGDDKHQNLKLLVRGTNQKTDAILDLLVSCSCFADCSRLWRLNPNQENGIFDALKKCFLAAIQLTIFVDKNAPHNILESYTFSFKYSGELGDLDKSLVGITFETTDTNCDADVETRKSARRGLEMIIRRLLLLNAFFPNLPSMKIPFPNG